MKKFDSGRGRLMGAAITALFALVCAQAQASASATGTPTSRSKTLRFRSASLDNPAGVHNRNPVAGLCPDQEVVRDEE